MKRISGFFSIALIGILLFVGCEKDGVRTFTATNRPYNGTDKAYVSISGSSAYMCWADGDAVQVNNTSTTASVRVVNGKTRVELSVPTTEAVGSGDDEYYAIYPASLAIDGYNKVRIPSSQTYRVMADGTQIIDAPMAAKVVGEGETLNFTNLASLLRIHFPQSDNVLTSITVTATDATLAGEYPMIWGATPSIDTANVEHEANTITLTPTSGVSLNVSGGKDFYVIIPPIKSEKVLTLTANVQFGDPKSWGVQSTKAIPENKVIALLGPDMTPETQVIEQYDYLYSQSSGYIDLGVKPEVGSKMELTFAVTNARNAQYLCGCRGSGGVGEAGDFQWFTLTGSGQSPYESNGFYATLCGNNVKNNVANGGWNRETNVKYTESVEIKQDANGVYGDAYFKRWADASHTGATNTLTTGHYNPARTPIIPTTVPNVLLFATRSSDLHAGMKCYSFRYYQGSTLMRDFKPVKVLEPGVVALAGGGGYANKDEVGMYDLLNDVFYRPNQIGATAFSVGNDPVVPAP